MHLSTVIAISGLLTTALGALSAEQLFVDIQNVQNLVTKADAYAENINAVNAVTDAEVGHCPFHSRRAIKNRQQR